ncbi:hypothetical protein TNCV_3242031 [Trichonephila clavipes]|nr:hypothetical protein TNCV_3242031 [Trichonephila clavipes]
MPPSTLRVHTENCGGGDRGGVVIYRPFGEFRRAKSYCHLYGIQGQRLAPCHDEFRAPRCDYVRQNPRSPLSILCIVNSPLNPAFKLFNKHEMLLESDLRCKLCKEQKTLDPFQELGSFNTGVWSVRRLRRCTSFPNHFTRRDAGGGYRFRIERSKTDRGGSIILRLGDCILQMGTCPVVGKSVKDYSSDHTTTTE